jgi:hypothetical protein
MHRQSCALSHVGPHSLAVPEIDRRNLFFMSGIGLLAAAIPMPLAGADPVLPGAPASPVSPLTAPPLVGAPPTYLFHDEFDGPAGSAPDGSKWMVAKARETIRNPVFWDKPENMGQYRDDREHVFLDGKSNWSSARRGTRTASTSVAS